MVREMKVTLGEGMRVDAEYKGHVIKTDQPKYAGGDDSAPAPFDLFLASLGTCSGLFITFFCLEREIPHEDIALSMRMEKDEETKLITKFEVEVTLPPDFPEKYSKAIVRAVEQCTVKRTMDLGPEFEVVVTAPSRTGSG